MLGKRRKFAIAVGWELLFAAAMVTAAGLLVLGLFYLAIALLAVSARPAWADPSADVFILLAAAVALLACVLCFKAGRWFSAKFEAEAEADR